MAFLNGTFLTSWSATNGGGNGAGNGRFGADDFFDRCGFFGAATFFGDGGVADGGDGFGGASLDGREFRTPNCTRAGFLNCFP